LRRQIKKWLTNLILTAKLKYWLIIHTSRKYFNTAAKDKGLQRKEYKMSDEPTTTPVVPTTPAPVEPTAPTATTDAPAAPVAM
jgi:hypothetical protein